MAVNIFSMPSSSALLLFSLAFGLTNARPWQGATKTALYDGDDWSPRPTQMPVNPRELFKRDHVDVAVCGWIGGNSASPAACGSGSSCVHDTIHGYVGCCTTSGPCTAGVYTSCVDDNSESWGDDSGLVDTGITTCGSGSYCYKNSYPGGYLQYNCGFSDQATTVETTFTGQPSSLLLQVVFTGVNFSPSAAPSSTSSSFSSTSASSSSTQTSSSQTSSQTSSSSSADSSSSSSKTTETSSKPSSTSSSTPNAASVGAAATTTAAVHSSSDTKAIVGGVVGGLAALTAILGVLLYLLQRRHAQRNEQRAGSFVSGLKRGQQPPHGPYQRTGPYSPDDFQSSMTERERPTPSTIAAAFPNNHLSPPEPAAQSFFSPPNLGEDARFREDAPLVERSEIDDFSRSYNEVMRYHQQTPEPREPEYHFETPGFDVPPWAPQHQLAGADPGPLDLIPVAATASGLRRGGSGGSERERQKERDRFMGEDKEDGGQAAEPSRYGNAVVREEGWSPQQLRPSPPRERDIQAAGVQRYQLVDDVPSEGVPVLHTPGQLRGSRAPRGRNSS